MHNSARRKLCVCWYCIFLIFGLILVLCPYKVLSQTTHTTARGVTELEDFESDSNPDPTFWNQWNLEGTTNAPNVIIDPTDRRNQVMECNISRPTSPYGSSNSRSEPTRREGTADIPEWLPYGFEGSYQYRFYIPSEFDWDPNGESHEITMTQFKPPRGVTSGKPNITFRIDNRHLNMIVRYETNETNVQNNQFTTVGYEGDGLITLNKGRWYYVVIDYTIHHNNTGMVKYYIKEGSFPSASDLMFSHTGGVCYNTAYSRTEGVYLKFGLYNWQWRTNGNIRQDTPGDAIYLGTDVANHTLYFDDVALQDHHEFTVNDEVSVAVDPAPNQAPIADAGPSQTITMPKNTVTLSGTASDADGNIASYLWTQQSGPDNANLTGIDGSSLEASDLIAGSYSFRLMVTDNDGAVAYDEVSVTLDFAPITVTAAIKNATCNADNGAIDLTISGGSGPFNFIWSNDKTNEDIDKIASGDYQVTIVDENGVALTKSFSVYSESNITLIAAIDSASCSKQDGAIQVTVHGGIAPYTYEWSNGSNKANIKRVPAGEYNVTVTDNSGCSKEFNLEIPVEPSETEFEVVSQLKEVSCNDRDGGISLGVIGDSGPYTYTWSDGSTDPNRSGLETGIYHILITDRHGCFMNAEYDIYQNSILTPTIIQSGDSLYTDVQAENYQWYKEGLVLEGATQNRLIINEIGSYMVQVSEENCKALSDPHEVEEILATNTNFTIQQVEIFPNPVVNHLSVRIYLNETAEIKLTLYDFQGTELWSQNLGSIAYYTAPKIDVSNYPPGIYFIKIAAGQEVLTNKIIKR